MATASYEDMFYKIRRERRYFDLFDRTLRTRIRSSSQFNCLLISISPCLFSWQSCAVESKLCPNVCKRAKFSIQMIVFYLNIKTSILTERSEIDPKSTPSKTTLLV
jgi:hypothetical protein